jgi:sarcosine oxidase delta subunit
MNQNGKTIYMQQELKFEKYLETLEHIKFKDWKLVGQEYSDCFFMKWVFMERDTTKQEDETLYEQHCRKWFVSKHSTLSEIIRTAWLAVQQAVQHETEESFLFNGVRMFDPHTDYVDLMKFMSTAKQDIRD